MLRYKTETRPGLVALYDIRPRNGAGQFLQPRSPQGATDTGRQQRPRLRIASRGNNHSNLTTTESIRTIEMHHGGHQVVRCHSTG